MGRLTAHLLEGFDHDRVALAVDDAIQDSKDDVTTSLLIGSAGELSAVRDDGEAKVRIAVPTRGLEQTHELDLRGDAHLLVSIEHGALSCRVTDAAPGFM
jgi:hypothetical protein